MPAQPHGNLIRLASGEIFPLLAERLTLGRRESCDIRLPYPNVSSLHCALNFRAGYWHIEDLNSTNGVRIKSQRVHKRLLMPGDQITIAKRHFKIEYNLPEGGDGEAIQDEPRNSPSTPSVQHANPADAER